MDFGHQQFTDTLDFVNFIVSSMHFERLEELNVFLALLFNSQLRLQCITILKDVIFDQAAKKNASKTIDVFIHFVDHVEKYYSEILTACSNSYSCYLSEAELSNENEQACIAFFNMILSDDYSPTDTIDTF